MESLVIEWCAAFRKEKEELEKATKRTATEVELNKNSLANGEKSDTFKAELDLRKQPGTVG